MFNINDAVQIPVQIPILSVVTPLPRGLVNRFPSGTGWDRDRIDNSFPSAERLLSLRCSCHNCIGSVHLEPFPLFPALSRYLLGNHCRGGQICFLNDEKNQHLSPKARPRVRSLASKARTAHSLKGHLFRRNPSATILSSVSGWSPTQIS